MSPDNPPALKPMKLNTYGREGHDGAGQMEVVGYAA